MAPETLALAHPPAAADAPAEERDFHCAGCGRRHFSYTPDMFTGRGHLRVRCRDCKTVTVLRGADVPGLLHALSHGRGADR
jgi:hypothetical protein